MVAARSAMFRPAIPPRQGRRRIGELSRVLASAAIIVCAVPARFTARGETLPELVSLEQVNLEEYEPAIREQISRAYEEAYKNPRSGAAAGKLGMIFQVYGKYDLAESCYRRARGLEPRSFRWAYYLGNVQGWLGKYEEAIEHVREAVGIDGSYAPARVRLAQLLFDSGDAEQSERVYREVLDQSRRSASAHFGLGKVLAARGDLAAAIGAYQRACELSPEYAAAHYALGLAYRQKGDIEKARLHLERYRRLKQAKKPSHDPLMDEVQALYAGGLTHFAKGSSLAQRGALKEAVAEFEAALEANPRLVMAHVNLIAMYGQLGRPDKAEQHFQAAIGLDPGWVETYYNWGMFLIQQKRKAEAAEMFRKAVEIDPNYANAHVQLAQLLDESGRPKEAAAEYRRALDIDPDHRQAHYLFAHNLFQRGEIEEAIKHLLETIKADDNRTPVSMRALAIAYEREGDRDRALYYVREALRRADSFGMKDLAAQLKRDMRRLSVEAAGR